jgi:hypothetical protein
MIVVPFYPPDSRRTEQLRERLIEMREDMLGRMLRRGSPEPGQLPIRAGIAAALKALDSREAQAPSTLDAETAIALANELVRAAAALGCAPCGAGPIASAIERARGSAEALWRFSALPAEIASPLSSGLRRGRERPLKREVEVSRYAHLPPKATASSTLMPPE